MMKMVVLQGKVLRRKFIVFLLSFALVLSLSTYGQSAVYASDTFESHGESTELYDDRTWDGDSCHTLYSVKDWDAATVSFIDISNSYPLDKKFTIPVNIQDTITCTFFDVVGINTVNEPPNHTHPAFFNDPWITEVRFQEPSLVTYIGDSSFKNSAVNKVLLPKSLQTIGANVFEGSALTVISLPPSVTSIGDSAFAAPSLTKIVFRGQTAPTLDAGAFDGLAGTGKVYYPEGADYSAIKGQLSSEAAGWTIEAYTDLNSVYPYAAEDNDLKKITSETPIISGTAKVGQKLTANPGSWNPSDVIFSYQWYAGGDAISGANKSTYTISKSDAGKTITVKVTGSKIGYIDTSKTSASTSKVTADFTKSPTPTISGALKVGKILTANVGTWDPKPTLKYQWYAGGKAISGATKNTYKLKAAQLGKTITVKVTGSAANYITKSTTSKETAKVTSDFTKAAVPKIKGTLKVGKKLSVNLGTWSPKPTYKYQWYANGKVIKGATKPTLVLKKAQKGKSITVKVTATKANYTKTVKTSFKTVKVK
jgi:hypothetical protein